MTLQKDNATIIEERRKIRKLERNLRRGTLMAPTPQPTMQRLEDRRPQLLPDWMKPSNMGNFSEIMWPFWYSIAFDFGDNPTWTMNQRVQQSFNVTQEAGYLLMGISRDANSYGTAGELAPLMVQFQDRQSTRQFCNAPVPILEFGKSSRPTWLTFPMFLVPNSYLDVIITSCVSNDQPTFGSGVHRFTFFGYRCRNLTTDVLRSLIFHS